MLAQPSFHRRCTIEAFSTLAPSTIPAISLQTIDEDGVNDLMAFWQCLTKYDLAGLSNDFMQKVLLDFKTAKPRCIPQMTKIIKRIPEVPGDHSVWLVALLEIYTIKMTGYEPEQPVNWSKGPTLGCGNCEECRLLNKFLANPRQKSVRFARAKPSRTHLESMFQPNYRLGFGQSSDGRFSWQTHASGSPHILEITKRYAMFPEYEEEYATWKQKKTRFKQFCCSLAPEQRLRTLLGSRHDDLVNARIVTLQRLPTGAPVPGTYQAPYPSKAVDIHAETSTASTASGPPATSSAAELKRKASDDDADENRPPKRTVEVIDLCDVP